MKSYNEILSDVTKTATKIPQSDYLDTGKYRIFDQGKEYSVGFSNDEQDVVSDYPYIIFGDHTRVVKYVNEPCFIGADGVKLLKVINKDFNPRFVYYNILAKPIENQGYARHFKFLKEIQFTEKTLSVQTNIVTELDTIQSAIDNKKQQLSLLDEAVKSEFVEMFGTENDFSKWNCCFVEDVADVTVGVVIKPTQYYCEKGIPAFRSLNIGEMKVNDSDWVYFTEEGNEKNRKSILKENDVLVVRSGAPGKSCVITKKYEGYNVVDAIIAHPNLEKVNPVFLCMFTNMPHGMNQIKAKTGGAAQQHFNVGGYNSLKIILPPLSLQNDFAAFVQQIDKSKFVVKQQIADLQELLDSKMQKYFGE